MTKRPASLASAPSLPAFIGDRFDALTQASPLIVEFGHDQWLVTHNEDRYLPEIRKVIDRIHKVLQDKIQPGR